MKNNREGCKEEKNHRRNFLKTGLISAVAVGVGSLGFKSSPELNCSNSFLENLNKPDKKSKISIRLEMLPGKSVLEKINNAERYGFDGIALPGRFLKDYIDELKKVFLNIPLPLISLSLGFEGSLVSPDPKIREKCKTSILNLFDLCNELKIKIFNMPPVLIKDNPERYSDKKVQDELLISQLYNLCEEGKKRDVSLLLEPVNRYETDYMTTQGHAAQICNIVKHDYLGITSDFYHMMMEELKTDNSISLAYRWIKHIHVAENTRVEPGPGSLDLKPGFKTLRELGYNGFIEVECRSLSGDPEIVFPNSVKNLRNLWDTA
jgi:sugar phosphate isomerase/epimerase